jgi:hypothetical protein
MMSGWRGASGPEPDEVHPDKDGRADEIAEMKKQLAEMQSKLSKL